MQDHGMKCCRPARPRPKIKVQQVRQEKCNKHGKTVQPKSVQMKHRHQSQSGGRHSEHNSTNSTADGSSFHNHHHEHHHCDEGQTLSHSCRPKKTHHHVSASDTSSCSSSSSVFSSSSSTSSSSSSPTSASSSSTMLSSDVSSECFDRHLLPKQRHSQSCSDISRKHKYFEEDDTEPLIDDECPGHKGDGRDRGRSPLTGQNKNAEKKEKISRVTAKDGSFRKAKSLESLNRPAEREMDENEQEKRKNEARINLMKEKMKFSAFLNEITRQVLSPMRLTTLGVTDAQRASSPGQATLKSGKTESSAGKPGPQSRRCRRGSADSISSNKHGRICKHSHSGRVSRSKSFHHHHRRSESPSRMNRRPRSCTDISCSQRRHSWSLSRQQRSQSPVNVCYHHRHHGHCHTSRQPDCHQHKDHQDTRHRHRRQHQSLSSCDGAHSHPTDHHGDHRKTSHHHGSRHCPVCHGGVDVSLFQQHEQYRNVTHYDHHGDHHFSGHHSVHAHAYRHGDSRHPTHYNKVQNSPTHHHGDHQSSDRHHHSKTGDDQLVIPLHHGQHAATNHDGGHQHHRGTHQNPKHHHLHRGHHKDVHQHHHGKSNISSHQHHYGDHHNEVKQHHHENHHRRGVCSPHADPHSESKQQLTGTNHTPNHQHHRGDPHTEAQRHLSGTNHSPTDQHHHGDYQSELQQHLSRTNHGPSRQGHHGDSKGKPQQHLSGNNRSPSHQHHHGDSKSEPQQNLCGTNHSLTHQHHLGDSKSEPQQHLSENNHSPSHQHHHGDSKSEPQQHLSGNNHSPTHQHQHGDSKGEPQQHLSENNHSPTHQHGDSKGEPQQHLCGTNHNLTHQHQHGDSKSEHQQNLSGNNHSPSHQQHHGDPHSETQQHHLGDQYNSALQHPDKDHRSPSLHHHHNHSENQQNQREDHNTHPQPRCVLYSSHQMAEYHDYTSCHHDDQCIHSNGLSGASLPSEKQLGSLPTKLDSLRNTSGHSNQDEEQTSSSSLHKEKELERITMLQEQNEGLHQTLLKTAVRMESLGEEFVSSQKLLEAELQRTCVELNNLTEKFKRLHDNCSSTQQTNNLLEQKLHSAVQDMEDERRTLNLRISALTEHLTETKSLPGTQTVHGTTTANKANECFQSDDDPRVALALTPPPAQFMGAQNCGKPKAAGQEQYLGSVPEEEESDWSETGEELPRFIQSETNRGRAWRHQGGDDRESWREEMARGQRQVPHLQFTIQSEILSVPQSENLCDSVTGEGAYRITAGPNLSSAILIQSASLEELPLSRVQKELRGTEAVMDLHWPADEAAEDYHQLLQHWRTSGGRDAIGSAALETESGADALHSAEVLLSHFLREPRPSGVKGHGSHQVYGWMEEVLQRERTQL